MTWVRARCGGPGAALGDGSSPQHRVDQPWESGLEVIATQGVQLRRPVHPLLDHAGLAQYPEVGGARRLGNGKLQAVAGPLPAVGDRLGDQQPDGIAQGVEYRWKLDLV